MLEKITRDDTLAKDHKVSVIVPAYNAASGIRACIESLLTQETQAHEIIVVNDASMDNTAEIVRGVGVRLIDRKKMGAQERPGPKGLRLQQVIS